MVFTAGVGMAGGGVAAAAEVLRSA